MKRIDAQKNLLYITKKTVEELGLAKIKGAKAFWEGDTAYITIFFDKKPSEDDIEDVSCACTEIIAEMPSDSFLSEECIVLSEADELPFEFLAYKRDES